MSQLFWNRVWIQKYFIFRGLFLVTQKIPTVYCFNLLFEPRNKDDKNGKTGDQLFMFSYSLTYIALISFHLFPLHFFLLSCHTSHLSISHPTTLCFTGHVFSRLMSLCNLFNFHLSCSSPTSENSCCHIHKHKPPASLFGVNTSGM